MRKIKSVLLILALSISLSYGGIFDNIKKVAELVDSETSKKSDENSTNSKSCLIENPKNEVEKLYNIVCDPESILRDRMGAWSNLELYTNSNKPSEVAGDAFYYLGECYVNGNAEPGSNRDHKNDYEYAVSRWESASELNHVKSLKRLGEVYSSEKIEKTDIEKAKEYWLRAAELGDSDSVRLIEEYFDKKEIRPDLTERVLIVLADNGCVDCQINLGQKLFKEGKLIEAKRYFELAKSKGNQIAIQGLEEIAQIEKKEKLIHEEKKSYLVTNPKSEVEKLYNIVCDPESSLRDRMGAWSNLELYTNSNKPSEVAGDALYYLGECYVNGNAEPGCNRDHKNDYEYAVSRWESASKINHVKSLKMLGEVYSSEKIEKTDIEKAKEYWLRAAELGDSDSVRLIEEYFDKKEIRPDLTERALIVLADNGRVDCQINLGQKLFKEGKLIEAKRYFELAKSKGDQIAIQGLEEIAQIEKKEREAAEKIANKHISIEFPLLLTEGAYDFPLNVSIDNVIKWAEENKLESTNYSLLGGIIGPYIYVIPCLKSAKTFEDFKEVILNYKSPSDEVINNIPLMEKNYLIEQASNFMSEIEQVKLLAKMADMTPQQKAIEPYRICEQAIISHLGLRIRDISQVNLADQPLVIIGNQQYFLNKIWAEGIDVELEDGSKLECKEERITDSIYEVGFTSSGESPDKFKLFPIKFSIYFYKTNENNLVSFAQIIEYLNVKSQNKSKLKESLISTLDKKYDGHVMIKPIQREDDRWDGKVVRNNCTAFHNTYNLLHHDRINPDMSDLEDMWYFWSVNISAIESRHTYGENSAVYMQLWFWTPQIVETIISERMDIITQTKDRHMKSEAAKFGSVKDAF